MLLEKRGQLIPDDPGMDTRLFWAPDGRLVVSLGKDTWTSFSQSEAEQIAAFIKRQSEQLHPA